MSGGLLQLIARGVADAPLTYNPEITFFKKVYKQHTSFSGGEKIKNNLTLLFDQNYTSKIEQVGDLLGKIKLKVEIPLFDIIKSSSSTTTTTTNPTINSLETDYNGDSTYLFYNDSKWYLIPNTFFNKSNNTFTEEEIKFSDTSGAFVLELAEKLDPNTSINFLRLQDSSINNIIPVLITNTNWLKQLWLDQLSNSSNVQLNKNLLTQFSFMNFLSEKIEKKLFFNYHNLYNLENDRNYYQINFENNTINELKQYLSYLEDPTIVTDYGLDLDISYKYALSNDLDTNDVLKNTLLEQAYVLYYILLNLYPNKDHIYTFFRYYGIRDNNEVNKNILYNNFNLKEEWTNKLNTFRDETIIDTEMKLPLLDKFKEYYYRAEKTIKTYILDLDLNNHENTWKFIRTQTLIFKSIIGGNSTYYDWISDVSRINTPTINDFNITLELITKTYEEFSNIENYPVDLFNLYPIILLYFEENVKKLNLDDSQFINWYRKKMTNFYYMRYKRISNFNGITSNFNGLVNYFNLDTEHYMTSDNLKEYLEEVMDNRSYICFAHLNRELEDTSGLGITPYELTESTLTNYDTSGTADLSGNGLFKNNFFELKVKNTYLIDLDNYSIISNIIKINDVNTLIKYDKRAEYTIIVDDILYKVTKIVKVEEKINFTDNKINVYYCTLENSVSFTTDIKLLEIIQRSIPLIKEPVSYSTNDFVSYDIYNKTTNNNLFIDEYKLNPFILKDLSGSALLADLSGYYGPSTGTDLSGYILNSELDFIVNDVGSLLLLDDILDSSGDMSSGLISLLDNVAILAGAQLNMGSGIQSIYKFTSNITTDITKIFNRIWSWDGGQHTIAHWIFNIWEIGDITGVIDSDITNIEIIDTSGISEIVSLKWKQQISYETGDSFNFVFNKDKNYLFQFSDLDAPEYLDKVIHYNINDTSGSGSSEVQEIEYFGDFTYLKYDNGTKYERQRVKIVKNNNVFKLTYIDDNGKLIEPKLNYKDFNNVSLEVFNLPIRKITISDKDCYDIYKPATSGQDGSLAKSYPKLYIKNTDLSGISLDTLVYTDNNIFGKLSLPDTTISDTDYNRQITIRRTDFNTIPDTSMNIYIYNNSYFPNVFSLNSMDTTGSVGDIMDFFIQSPIMLQMKGTTENLPVFILQNIPYELYNTNDTSNNITRELYLNNYKLDIFKEINSGMINRQLDVSGSTLKGSGFDMYSSAENIDSDILYYSRNEMKKKILNIFDETINSNSDWKEINTMLDNAQKEYMKLYENILDDIYDYGKTLGKIFDNSLLLNETTFINNITKKIIDFRDMYIYNYDNYSKLAIGLYNIPNTTLSLERKFIDNTIHTELTWENYPTAITDTSSTEFTELTNNSIKNQTIFDIPWYKYTPYEKLTSNTTRFLDNYKTEIERQLEYYNDNKDYDIILNSSNYKNTKDVQEELCNNISKVAFDYSTDVKIKLFNPFKYTGNTKLGTDTTEPYSEIYYNGNKLNIDSVNGNKEFNVISTEQILPYEYKNTYKETIYKESLTKIREDQYNLITAVRIDNNNNIDFNPSISLSTSTDYYLVSDDNIVCEITNNNSLTVDKQIDGMSINSKIVSTISSSNIDIIKRDNIYYQLIESTDLSGLDISVDYFIISDDIFAYGKYLGSNQLELISLEHNVWANEPTIFYGITSLDTSGTINILENELLNSISITGTLKLTNFEVKKNAIYNYYFDDDTWTTDKFILSCMTSGIEGFFNQDYSDYTTLKDRVFLNLNLLENNETVKKYIVDTSGEIILPPYRIVDKTINIIKPLESIDWSENSNYWIRIGETETQVKNFDTSGGLAEGNYLFYYCPSETQPSTDKLRYCNYYDSYSINEDLSGEVLKYNPYGKNYIFPSNTRLQLGNNSDSCGSGNFLFDNSGYKIKTDTQNYGINAGLVNIDYYSFDNKVIFHSGNTNMLLTHLITDLSSNNYIRPILLKDKGIDLNIENWKSCVNQQFLSRTNYNSYQHYDTSGINREDTLKVISTIEAATGETENLFLTRIIYDTSSNYIIKCSNSDILMIENNDGDYSLEISNAHNIEQEKFHKIEFESTYTDSSGLETVEPIITWLLISDNYINPDLSVENSGDFRRITEPLIVDYDISGSIYIQGDSAMVFDNVDTEYFINNISYLDTYNYNNSITTIMTILKDSPVYVERLNDMLLSSYTPTETITGATTADQDEFINCYIHYGKKGYADFNIISLGYDRTLKQNKFWDIIDDVEIYENKYIKLENNIFTKLKHIIFIKDNKYYSNKIIKTDNNYAYLEDDIEFNEVSVLGYFFEPVFIKEDLIIDQRKEKVYITCKFNLLERKEIIYIGDCVILILNYDIDYEHYVGEIISSNKNLNNTITGFYHLGKISNYDHRYEFIQNNPNPETNFYLKNTKISNLKIHDGDFIIYNKQLYIYNSLSSPVFGEPPSSPYNEENIFTFGQGVNFKIYYSKSKDKFYQLDTNVNLLNKPVITHSNVYPCSPLRILDVINGEIIWQTDPKPDILMIGGVDTTDGDYVIDCYLPIQPFKIITLNISNNIVTNLDNFSGWIEILSSFNFIRCDNSVLKTSLPDGDYDVRIMEDNIPNADFTDSFEIKYKNLDVDNEKQALSRKMELVGDSSGVFLRINDSSNNEYLDFRDLKCYYNQPIWIDTYISNIINVTKDRLYINETTTNLLIGYKKLERDIVGVDLGWINLNIIETHIIEDNGIIDLSANTIDTSGAYSEWVLSYLYWALADNGFAYEPPSNPFYFRLTGNVNENKEVNIPSLPDEGIIRIWEIDDVDSSGAVISNIGLLDSSGLQYNSLKFIIHSANENVKFNVESSKEYLLEIGDSLWYSLNSGPYNITITDSQDSINLLQPNYEYNVILSSSIVNEVSVTSNNFKFTSYGKLDYPRYNKDISGVEMVVYNSRRSNSYYGWTSTDTFIQNYITNNDLELTGCYTINGNVNYEPYGNGGFPGKFISSDYTNILFKFRNNPDSIGFGFDYVNYYLDGYKQVWFPYLPTELPDNNRYNTTGIDLRIEDPYYWEFTGGGSGDGAGNNIYQKYLLEEILPNDDIFIHQCYITLVDGFPKINSYTELENMKESKFYLNRTFPIRILSNYYFQLLPPDVKITRTLSNKNKKNLDIWTELKIGVNNKPLLTTDGFIYDVYGSNFDFDVIKYQTVYLDKTKNYPATLSVDTSQNKITVLDYNNFSKTTTFNTSTVKIENKKYFMIYVYDAVIIKSIEPQSKEFQSNFTNNNNNLYERYLDTRIIKKYQKYKSSILLWWSSKFLYNIYSVNQSYLPSKYQVEDPHLLPIIRNSYDGINISVETIIDIPSVNNKETEIKKSSLYEERDHKNIYMIETTELSVSVPSLVEILTNFDINVNTILNIAKDWNKWSILSTYTQDIFSNNITQGNIYYDGSGYSRDTSGVYYTTDEVESLKATLKFIYDSPNPTFETIKISIIQRIPEIFPKSITIWSKTDLFWNDVETNLEHICNDVDYIYEYNNSYNIQFKYIRGCIVFKDTSGITEVELYPENFDLSGEFITRKLKYENEYNYTINTGTGIVSVAKDMTKISSQITHLINNTFETSTIEDKTYGINIDKLFQELIRIGNYRKTFISDLKNNEADFLYNYNNPLKKVINQIWENEKEKGNNARLNRNMNHIMQISNQYNNSGNLLYSGLITDNKFNEERIGLDSHSKLKIKELSLDSQILFDASVTENICNNIPFSYNIKSNNQFPYEIQLSENNLETKTNYQINILEGPDKIKDPLITNPELRGSNLSFYLDNDYSEKYDFSVIAKEEYSISSKTEKGKLYSLSLDRSILGVDYYIYYVNKEVVLKKGNGTSNIELITDEEISENHYLDLLQFVHLKETLQVSSNTRLTLDSNFDTFYDNSGQVFLDYNSGQYEIFEDLSGYYISSEVTLDIGILYETHKFIDIIDISNNSIQVTDLNLDREIDNFNTLINPKPLPISFDVSGLTINEIELKKSDCIRVYYASDTSSAFTSIIHSFNLNETKPYTIIGITNQNKYLYTLDHHFRISDNNLIQFTDSSGESYIAEYYSGKTSITNNETAFILDLSGNDYIETSELNTMNLLIQNTWEFTDVTKLSDTLVSVSIPTDFFLYTDSEYNYNVLINSLTDNSGVIIEISNSDLLVTIDTYASDISGFTIIQNYEETLDSSGTIVNTTKENKLIEIDTSNNYWNINEQEALVHIVDNNYSEISEFYLYSFTFTEAGSVSLDNKYINVFIDNVFYRAYVISLYNISGTTYQCVFGIKEILDFVNISSVIFEIQDCNVSDTVTINKAGQLFEKCIFYKQEESKKQQMFVNRYSLLDYDKENELSSNNIIVSFRDNKPELINKYDPIGFSLSDNYKSTQTTTTTTTTEKLDNIWKDTAVYDFLKRVDFYLDDEIIESLDKSTMQIEYNYFMDRAKKESWNKLIEIRKTETDYYFYLPLQFWFTKNPTLYLPLLTMINNNMSIKMKLNKLENMLNYNSDTSGISFTQDGETIDIKSIKANVDIFKEIIKLGDDERKKLANMNHSYVIERYNKHTELLLSKEKNISNMNFNNMVKTVFWITRKNSDKNELTFYTSKTDKDTWYNEYCNIYEKYVEYKKTKTFSSDIPTSYSDEFIRLEKLENEIALKSSMRYLYIKNSKALEGKDLLYSFYLDDKYLNHLPTYGLVIIPPILPQRISVLSLYYKHVFKNNTILKPVPIVNKLLFKANGENLLPEQDNNYYNYVAPNNSFKEIPEDGYLLHSFDVKPKLLQPSGHLNFNELTDVIVKTELNSQVTTEPIILETITKEYAIMKIVGGIAGLIK